MAELQNISLPTAKTHPVDESKLLACIHCGLCLPSCPTHVISGKEMPSPRGRLYLMRGVMEGRIEEKDEAYQEHEWSCLVCRACETACPSGVEFGYLMEQARESMRKNEKPSLPRNLIYNTLLPSRRLLSVMQRSLSLTTKLGLSPLLRAFGRGLSKTMPSVGAMLRLLPNTIAPPAHRPTNQPAAQGKRGTVGLLIGCVGDVFTSEVNNATIRVLHQLGWNVTLIDQQATCCGALAIHAGYRERALALGRIMIDAALDAKVDFFLSNIAGCGAMLKDYEHLFAGTVYEERAKRFRAITRDINEFLVEECLNDLQKLQPRAKTKTVIGYQAPCHLYHAQRITDTPMKVVQSIDNTTVHYLPENDLCCGSAGSYNIEHPAESDALLSRKLQIIKDTGATVIITANAGCLMQLQKGVRESTELRRKNVRILHLIQYLDEVLSSN